MNEPTIVAESWPYVPGAHSAYMRAAADFEEKCLRLALVTGQPVAWCSDYIRREANTTPLPVLEVADRIYWWATLGECRLESSLVESVEYFNHRWWW